MKWIHSRTGLNHVHMHDLPPLAPAKIMTAIMEPQ
jgi:hypothetical protein